MKEVTCCERRREGWRAVATVIRRIEGRERVCPLQTRLFSWCCGRPDCHHEPAVYECVCVCVCGFYVHKHAHTHTICQSIYRIRTCMWWHKHAQYVHTKTANALKETQFTHVQMPPHIKMHTHIPHTHWHQVREHNYNRTDTHTDTHMLILL